MRAQGMIKLQVNSSLHYIHTLNRNILVVMMMMMMKAQCVKTLTKKYKGTHTIHFRIFHQCGTQLPEIDDIFDVFKLFVKKT